MKRLRIFPEMWARTKCLLARATRNMVPARTAVMVPSVSMISSTAIMCRWDDGCSWWSEAIFNGIWMRVIFVELGRFDWDHCFFFSQGDAKRKGGEFRQFLSQCKD